MTVNGSTLPDDELARRLAALSPAERADLMRRIAAARGAESAARAIPRRDRSVPAPLSFAQELLWLFEQASPGVAAYNVPRAFQVEGALDLPALKVALEAICRRHEVLRTGFVLQHGRPVQVVRDAADVVVRTVHLHGSTGEQRVELDNLLRDEARRPFDLERDTLLRALVARTDDGATVLLLTSHHIATDGWSRGVMLNELAEAYAAALESREPELPPLPIQYADYAAWERSDTHAVELGQQLAWWREQLRGPLPALELPTDRPRGATSFEGARFTELLPAELMAGLRRVAQAHDATLYMVLLAALQTVLYRYTGQTDILIGSPVGGRTRPETESLIGYFGNTLVLRGDVSGSPTFAELIGRARHICLEAFERQTLPFDQLSLELRARGEPSGASPFQVLFTLEEGREASAPLGSATLVPLAFDPGWSKLELGIGVGVRDDGLWISIEYRTALFDRDRIERFATHLRTLLEAIVADPTRPVSHLPLLSPAERHQVLVEWNRTATDYPRDIPAHALIEAQARRTPDAVAVTAEGASLTYRALNRRANQLAAQLRAAGVGPEIPVGVHLPRSLDLPVAILATLKAGGAYVPIDPAYPSERVRYMLDDARSAVLLTHRALATRLGSPAAAAAICLDAGAFTWSDTDAHWDTDERGAVGPEHLAYVIYTSGSTGRPKGAMITHRGLVNYLTWAIEAYGARDGSGAPVHSSISFDLTVTSLLVPLAAGTPVHLIPEEGAVDALIALLHARRDLTLVKLTPAHLELLRQAVPPDVLAGGTRCFVIGGESLLGETIAAWQRHAPDTLLVNEYGPTETVVGCCVHTLRGGAALPGAVPIGKPIANTQLYVLDAALQPVPIGVPGELYIAGDGVGRGYLGRPELTAERFLADPVATTPGARMYRTGDIVRWRVDGVMEFLGRRDDQVKIRGYRIELGEVEATLAAHPGVRQAAAAVRPDGQGSKRLVAWYVPGPELISAELRTWLRERLPDYMVPARLHAVPAIPVTPNGKRDLSLLASDDPDETVGELPATLEETAVAEIWRELLGRDRITRDDDFFELGGHSLLGMRTVAKLRQLYGVALPMSIVFERRTLREMGGALHDALMAIGAQSLGDMVSLLEQMSDEDAAHLLSDDVDTSHDG